jgi:hypothetical protein
VSRRSLWIVDDLAGGRVTRPGHKLPHGGVRLIDSQGRTIDLPASMVHGRVGKNAGPGAVTGDGAGAVVGVSTPGPAPSSGVPFARRSGGEGVEAGAGRPPVPAPPAAEPILTTWVDKNGWTTVDYPAVARTTDPVTSWDAARTVDVLSDRELVLRAHIEAGEHGLTGEELAVWTGRRYESVGPRRPGLVADGLLRRQGRRPNSRGNMQDVYIYQGADRG